MSLKLSDSTQPELKLLWGARVPRLTPEEIDLSIQVWQKIKARRQRELYKTSESEGRLQSD